MNFVSLIRSDYSATSASLIVEFTFVSVSDASKFSLGIQSRLGSGLGLELLEKIFRAPVYRAHCAVIFAIAQLSCFTTAAAYYYYYYYFCQEVL